MEESITENNSQEFSIDKSQQCLKFIAGSAVLGKIDSIQYDTSTNRNSVEPWKQFREDINQSLNESITEISRKFNDIVLDIDISSTRDEIHSFIKNMTDEIFIDGIQINETEEYKKALTEYGSLFDKKQEMVRVLQDIFDEKTFEKFSQDIFCESE